MRRWLAVAAAIVVVAFGGGLVWRAHYTKRPKDVLVGWLWTQPTESIFVQWTQSQDRLTGAVQFADLSTAGDKLNRSHASFTGVLNGHNISLIVGGDTWNGSIAGSALVLSVTNDRAELVTVHFHRAPLTAFTVAASALQRSAASTDDRLTQTAADMAALARERADQQAAAEAEAAKKVHDDLVAAYRRTCAAHGGTLSESSDATFGAAFENQASLGEYCTVTYQSEGAFIVPVKAADGTFDTSAADANRRTCQADAENAQADASNGDGWKAQPRYHSDSGVCFEGER